MKTFDEWMRTVYKPTAWAQRYLRDWYNKSDRAVTNVRQLREYARPSMRGGARAATLVFAAYNIYRRNHAAKPV